ncbi:MAG TPA: heparinase II/III family protein, partial [Candidatus Nanopelagicales bacterium]|nr:heparinase II/III family protein [Candidatus Nanopelagicales bacterium]
EGEAMVAQFMALLRSWVATHPPESRTRWMNHPQYGGFRLATFVCGVREVANARDNAWLVRQAQRELRVQLDGYFLSGSNNTMLTGQLAAYAAAKTVGTRAQQRQAREHLLALAGRQSYADGSDREGAPGYGLYAATILSRAGKVFAAFGQDGDAATIRARLRRSGDFLAAASRPDRRLETLGDTDFKGIPDSLYPNGSAATWVATSGERGSRPPERYTDWTGGYAFGRSGWVAGQDESSTFYSFRTGRSTPGTAHRHSDTTAVTFYSRGVSWVADPGPYRYDSSALRAYVRGRAAHSALVTAGSAAFVAPARWVRSRSSRGVDRTCARDPAYERTARLQVVRCVYYVRTLDALVVQDFVRPTDRSTRVRQQYLLPPGVTAARSAGNRLVLAATTASGADRNATVTSNRRAVVSVKPGTRSLLGRDYGIAETGTMLAVPWRAPVGLTSRAVTVLTTDGAPAEVLPGRRDGKRVLTVKVGSRSAVVDAGYHRFARAHARVGFSASKARLGKGRRLVLSGRVEAAGRAVRGATVRLQRHPQGKGRWVQVAATRTGAAGRYRIVAHPREVGTFRYRTKVTGTHGSAGWKPGTSEPRIVKVTRHR